MSRALLKIYFLGFIAHTVISLIHLVCVELGALENVHE